MMDDGKNKGSDDFDDTFEDDFSDVEFDEASYDENADYSEFSSEEEEYEGDDFETDDWGDAEGEPVEDNKKSKKKAKSGASFNTLVIIGAVVLGGGVMAFNIMKETGKQQAAQPSMFQSILNIGGIMDGTLFGEEKSATDTQSTGTPAAGFLNSPSTVAQDGTTPPQPVPLAPAEQDTALDPLTPMPEITAAPRGPEDVPPVEQAQADIPPPAAPVADILPDSIPAPEQAAPASAEDILKQAMANRGQKQQDATVPPVEAAPVAPPVPVEEPVPAPVAPAEEVAVTPPAPVEAAPAPVTAEAALSDEDRKALNESQQAVSALGSKLDDLLKRIDRIEGDLGAIRSEQSGPSQSSSASEELEEAVAALRKDLAEIKSRPVASAAKSEPAEPKKTAPKAAAAPSAPKKAATQVPAPKKAAQQQGRWELRAAQPGRAWVSKPGERDMQAVAVGDTLAGIGRISAITYQNGRWSVIGTQGALQQ